MIAAVRMNSSNLLQKLRCSATISFRQYFKDLPEPIEYPGFKYYPRYKDFKDPPDFKPSKLFLIKRLKSMKGRNPEERKALEELNIDGEKYHDGHINIVKNTPGMNARLWKVKHLVEIRPIHWKGELPKDDFTGTYLRHTGEFIISPKIKITESEIKSTEKYLEDKHRLRPAYLKEYLRHKWNIGYSGHI